MKTNTYRKCRYLDEPQDGYLGRQANRASINIIDPNYTVKWAI